MLSDERAEHRLAFKISASILAILIAVAGTISVFFYVLKQQWDREILSDWITLVISDPNQGRLLTEGKPNDIDLFYTRSRRIPPPFRNIAVDFGNADVNVYGPLAAAESNELELPRNNRADTPFERNIWGRNYIFLGKQLPDRTLYVYASQEGELGHFSREIFSVVIACFLFTLGLYFVARRIAKESFAPLKESLEVMGLYNRNIAHELRTPLAVLKSDLELAWADNPSERIASAIEEANSIEKIIDGLLFLAENKTTAKKESVRVSTAIKKKWEVLIRKHTDRKVELEARSKKKLEGNPELIAILLWTLLENAFLHSKDASKIVVRDTENGIVIENEVEKDIPDSVMAHIFEPFIKFKSTGSGLWLSMARRIAEIHGWKMTLDQKNWSFAVSIDTTASSDKTF